MKINDIGLKLIADFEGLSLVPYYATAEEKQKGIVTIGYGNTFYPNGTKVKITDVQITKAKAMEYLKFVADSFAVKVDSLVTSNVTQNQFNALVSLAYNIGLGNFDKSTILKLVNNNPNDGNIAKEFLKWNKQAGKVLNGLTNRRIKESALYFTK
jgi:lysozyme